MTGPVYRLADLELPPTDRPIAVAIYAPVYHTDSVPRSAVERTRMLRGWTATSFRLDDLVNSLGASGDLVDIALRIDGSSTSVDLDNRPHVVREEIAIYGRTWNVDFAPMPTLGTPSDDWKIIVWAGVVASLSLTGVVGLLATQRARLRRDVDEATREIAHVNRQLERDSRFQRALMANLQVGVILVDHRGRLETYNLDTEGLYHGRLDADFDGSWSTLLGLHTLDGELLPEERNPMLRVLAGERLRDVEVLVRPAGGDEHVVSCNGQPIEDANGRPTGAVVTIHDITELKQAQAKLEQLARHDPLTGLANRALLAERLSRAMEAAARRESLVALFFLDLDGFKAVNDVYGHDIGDELLRVVAVRLARTARSTDTVARLGGDEFVVLCEDVAAGESLDHLRARIVEALEQPYELDRVPDLVIIGVSIGLAFAEPGDDASSLLRRADERMYLAKAERRRGASR
jgi:diguanylate cyclase (GGDEF)-like protein